MKAAGSCGFLMVLPTIAYGPASALFVRIAALVEELLHQRAERRHRRLCVFDGGRGPCVAWLALYGRLQHGKSDPRRQNGSVVSGGFGMMFHDNVYPWMACGSRRRRQAPARAEKKTAHLRRRTERRSRRSAEVKAFNGKKMKPNSTRGADVRSIFSGMITLVVMRRIASRHT